MKSIHILFGESGDYEERQRWTIAAYTSKAQAEAEQAALDELAGRIDERVEDLAGRMRDDDIGWDEYDSTSRKLTARMRKRDRGTDETWVRPRYTIERLRLR